MRVCVNVWVCVFARVRSCHWVCVPDAHMRGFDCVCDPGSHSWRKWRFAFSHNSLLCCLQQYITHRHKYMKHTICLSRVLNRGFTVSTPLRRFHLSVAFLPTQEITLRKRYKKKYCHHHKPPLLLIHLLFLLGVFSFLYSPAETFCEPVFFRRSSKSCHF